MNFAQMLSATPPIKSRKKPKPNTTEQIQKWKEVTRAGRNERWKKAFMAFDNKATAQQLCGYLGFSEMGTSSQLLCMRRETPPCIEKIGEINNGSNGRKQYVYQWIGD